MNTDYKNSFEKSAINVIFNIMKMSSKVFLPVGLELNSMNIYFDLKNEFPLKDMTFAYYNPIENSIHINIEDEFFTSSTNLIEREAKLFFALYHEAMHKILMHVPQRLGDRKKMLWNIAADYEIHNMYYVYSKHTKYDDADALVISKYLDIIDNILINKSEKNYQFMFDTKYLENIAEEIYEMIRNSEETSSKSYSFSLSDLNNAENNEGMDSDSDVSVTVTETTYTLPDGTKVTDVNIEWPENSQLPDSCKKSEKTAEQEAQTTACNRSLLENVFDQMSKEKGNGHSGASKFLKKLFHVKIDWTKILKNSLQTALEKSDYFAWNSIRTSTFLLPNMAYLPNIVEDETKYGTLIISRDESGSMSDSDIAKAGQIILDAKEYYNKIVLIKHDTSISKIYEFEEISDDIINVLKTRESCGGTSHKQVFEYLRDYKKTHNNDMISCYIGISDLESDIEDYQNIIPSNIPVLYLAPINSENHFNNIKGRIIPIEL